MNDKDYQDLVDEYIDKVASFVKDEGGINPHIAIFAEKKEEEDGQKNAIIHLDIPNFDVTEFSQEQFLETILPQIFTQVKEEFDVRALAFTAEAFVRIAAKDFDPEKEDFRKIPVEKEVLFISLETKDKTDIIVFELRKDGQIINPDGKLIDKIELVREDAKSSPTAAAGVYNDLWKKYML